MAQFLVRVELHSASQIDYDKLHIAMAKAGFSRTIISGDGVAYSLPTAEYTVTTTSSLAAVRNAATNAANTTGRNSWVIAVESAGMSWVLPKA